MNKVKHYQTQTPSPAQRPIFSMIFGFFYISMKDWETKHIMLQYGWWTCPTERRKERTNDEGQNLMKGMPTRSVSGSRLNLGMWLGQCPGRSCCERLGWVIAREFCSTRTEAERGPSTMLMVALGASTPGPINILRKFVALHYERHPESVRGCQGLSCRP